MFHSMLFLAQLDEKPDATTVWLVPSLFLLLGAGCWFYAFTSRKNGQDRWWRWVTAYVFLGVALYVTAMGAFSLFNPFVWRLVSDSKKVVVGYWASFALSVIAIGAGLLGQFKGKRSDTDGLSF